MEGIRLIVEQEIASLRKYESEYRKSLQGIDEDHPDSQLMEALYSLDGKISTIKSWLLILSVEENLCVTACVVDNIPLSRIPRVFIQTYCLSEEAICMLRDRGMEKITRHLYDEYGDVQSVLHSLN